jgi:hypothetical protein
LSTNDNTANGSIKIANDDVIPAGVREINVSSNPVDRQVFNNLHTNRNNVLEN